MRIFFIDIPDGFFSWWKGGKSSSSTLPEGASPPPKEELPPPPENWRGAFSVEVGDKHMRSVPPVPCQDFAFAQAEGGVRPCAFVADGAGSAEMSHFGSGLAVLSLKRYFSSEEAKGECVRLLDGDSVPTDEDWDALAHECIENVSESIKFLAERCGMSFKKFHCTLLGAVVGHKRIFWFHVGDGFIVVERNGENLQVVGAEEKTGAANVTNFVKEDAPTTTFRCGIIPADEVTGLALMTDGSAQKLVANDGSKVAPPVSKKFLAGVRNQEFGSAELYKFLSNPEIWKPPGYDGDDKGMALLAKVS